jgi:lipopolysaccharide transport system ATP-binding protein
MANPVLPVQARSVSKSYPVFSTPTSRLRQLMTRQQQRPEDQFWALRDVSFDIARGETFCVIGQNGSGKSTLLQLISGIFPPTMGDLQVQGRLAALLELGAGFNPDFTGRENLFLNGSLLGFSRAQLRSLLPAIERFAEIGHFIDQPVKTYSSGMLVRLAFAIAVHTEPEILIVDEALAVGDIYFRQRCMRKVHELKRQGTTIIYVTHSASDVRAIGDRCLWLDAGQMRELGEPEGVISRYLAEMTMRDGRYVQTQSSLEPRPDTASALEPPELVEGIANIDHRYGDARAEIIGIALTDDTGNPLPLLRPHHEAVLRVCLRAHSRIESPIVGYVLRNHLGIDMAVSNTLREGIGLSPLAAGSTVVVDFHLMIPELYPGSFSFSAAIADGELEAFTMCDSVENAVCIEMDRGLKPIYGYLHLPCRIGVNQRLSSVPAQGALNG